MVVIETDARSRVIIPGRSNEMFVVRDNADGSMLLEPAHIVTDAQREYDSSPELQELLSRATASTTVHRARRRRLV